MSDTVVMKTWLVTLIILVQSTLCIAADLRSFLKTCAWGTMGGAAVGVVSMAFSDKPGDSWNNVAKGASLGLYAGIGYGVYQLNKSSEPTPAYSVVPQFSRRGNVDGVHLSGTVFEF